VIGTSGSGKSTFARELAARIGVPYVELDALKWRPGWTPAPEDEFIDSVSEALSGESWVVDGNYPSTAIIRFTRADHVIWLDNSLPRTLFRMARRSFRYVRSGQELWPDTGNNESFRRAFLSRDSMILWVLRTFRANRRRYTALMASTDYPHLTTVRLRGPRAARAYLESLADARETATGS